MLSAVNALKRVSLVTAPHQIVQGVLRLDLADLHEALGEGGHHVTHEVVSEGDGLRLEHLLLLLLHLGQLSVLLGGGGHA